MDLLDGCAMELIMTQSNFADKFSLLSGYIEIMMTEDIAFGDDLLDIFSDHFDGSDFDAMLQSELGSEEMGSAGSCSDGDENTSTESVSGSSSNSGDSVAPSSPSFGFSNFVGEAVQKRPLPRLLPGPAQFSSFQVPVIARCPVTVLSSSEAPENTHDNKRVKRDDRLIKNRESANKSRLKRKNEKLEMEETIAELRARIKTLELENTALVTDNTSLNSQNLFLRSLLTDREKELARKQDSSFGGSVSGVAILCVVCACSFASDWMPSAFKIQNVVKQHRHPGRVLLSLAESTPVDLTTPYAQAVDRNPQSVFHLCLILFIAACYFLYVRYQATRTKKSVLP